MPATTEASGLSITILVDNEARDGLVAEHGLSLWIETDGRRILFDTGQGEALMHNARTIGVNLMSADSVVLSHGHYDHTGSALHALKCAQHATVYCHPGAVQPRFSIRNGEAKSIGMPDEARAAISRLPPHRLCWVTRPVLLSDRVGITGPMIRTTDFEDTGGPFYLDPQGQRPDLIEDDLALWIRTEQGLVICTGCAHAGLVNTLEHVLHLAGDGAAIRAVIGGFHLLGAELPRLEHTAARLKAWSPEMVVPCHCTGKQAAAFLGSALGRSVVPGAAGLTIRLGL